MLGYLPQAVQVAAEPVKVAHSINLLIRESITVLVQLLEAGVMAADRRLCMQVWLLPGAAVAAELPVPVATAKLLQLEQRKAAQTITGMHTLTAAMAALVQLTDSSDMKYLFAVAAAVPARIDLVQHRSTDGIPSIGTSQRQQAKQATRAAQ